MKPCVIFLMYHGQGHFNPCFRLAKILEQEYDVVFAGYRYFQNYVKGQGFNYYPLSTVPFGLGFEPWMNAIEKKKNIYWSTLKDRWNDRLYNLRKAELYQLLNDKNPAYLFIDSAQSTDFIALYPVLKEKGIRTAIIHANLSTITTIDIPPLCSSALPNDLASVKRAHRKFWFSSIKKTIIQSIKYFVKSNDAIVKKRISLNKIPLNHISNERSIFSIGIDHIDHFIMAPAEFEFPSDNRPRHHYLGFMIDTTRKEIPDPEFERAFQEINNKISSGRRLIYCSFGTVQYDNIHEVNRFLHKLLSSINKSPDLLMISGNAFELLKDRKLPENVFIFKTVPHFQVLPKTSLFIMHGGFNSVKESIYAGVPMLVYPVDSRTDQNGNAARIVYHQLGLRGDLLKDSEKDITQKIEQLMTDQVFKKNIEEILKKDQSYTPANLIDLIKKIEPL